jgi:hypothetical protein
MQGTYEWHAMSCRIISKAWRLRWVRWVENKVFEYLADLRRQNVNLLVFDPCDGVDADELEYVRVTELSQDDRFTQSVLAMCEVSQNPEQRN